jgi:hypothetical protein
MSTIPKKMSAVLTTGHGGYEVLEFRNDFKVPTPESDQVLIKVLGAGINNTDINTRTALVSPLTDFEYQAVRVLISVLLMPAPNTLIKTWSESGVGTLMSFRNSSTSYPP